MSSAWLSTELSIYESHVGLETVGQAAAIREAIRAALRQYQPERFLYLGCAGGNGLEAAEGTRVTGIDLNAAYLEQAQARYSHLEASEFVVWDLNQGLPPGEPVDFAFGALIFEYIEDVAALLRALAERISGRLLVLLLATRENAPAVAESPYREALQPVGREFRYLSVEGFAQMAADAGFVLESSREIGLPAGKYFVAMTLGSRL